MMLRVRLWLLGLTALCSACATPAPVAVMAPVAECPAPPRPALPGIDAALPFDHPRNIESIMIRDDVLRNYIRGIESALECYRTQGAR